MIAKLKSKILLWLGLEPSEVEGEKPPAPHEIAREYVFKVNRGVVVPSNSSEHRLLTVSQAYLRCRQLLQGATREVRTEAFVENGSGIPSARRHRLNALLDEIQRAEDL